MFNPGSYLLFCLFPDLHLQNLQPVDRAGCRRLGLDFGRQCASLHRPRVNLRTHQLTAGDLSPDFLLFWGWFRFFFLRVSCISFSGSSLNGCKNNPYAPVRPTQGECLLFFSITMMVIKVGKCLTDSRSTLITCTLLSLTEENTKVIDEPKAYFSLNNYPF